MTTLFTENRTMFTELRIWPTRRWIVAVGVAVVAFAGLMITSGMVATADGVLAFPGPWWAYAVAAAGTSVVGLIVASYIATPIGADATLCDLRWPILGLIALHLSTDLRTAVPVLTGAVRPAVAVAAVALLVWALVERLGRERRAIAGGDQAPTATGVSGTPVGDDLEDGAVCTTCRPLFSRRTPPGRVATDGEHIDPESHGPQSRT